MRSAFPQFAQKGPNGVFMQQDAEECWTQVLLAISQKLPALKSASAMEEDKKPNQLPISNSVIGQLFSGELVSTYVEN